MADSSHDSRFLPPSSSFSPPPSQHQYPPQPHYYHSPTPTFSPTTAHPASMTVDPLLVTNVRKRHFLCLLFLRYSTAMPPELAPYMAAGEYAASIKRLNAALTCRSWVWTFVVLALCFFLSGAIMVGFGASDNDDDDSYGGGNTGSGNATVVGGGGSNSTASASAQVNGGGGNEVLLKMGIAFSVFSFACLMFTNRRWRFGRAKELTNVLLIENSRYAQRRPVIRFRLLAGGWMEKAVQRSAPLRRWVLQVEVCNGSGMGDGGYGGGQHSGSSFTVVNLPHSNVMRLRERTLFPVRPQPHGPALVDITEAVTQPVVPLLLPMNSGGNVQQLNERVDDDADDVSENPQQPPPAYSDIEMQPQQHNQPQQQQQQQQPTQPLPILQPSAVSAHPSHLQPITQFTTLPATGQSAEWQPVEKAAAGAGAVVMLSSQAAVVDEGKVKEYEEQLRQLVVERAQQDEKMQEMQRELENMRAQQQQPLVIQLTDFSSSSDGVMRSLPPGSDQQSQQVEGSRLAVYTNQQAEGSTPHSNAAPGGSSRSGVVMLAGRRFSF